MRHVQAVARHVHACGFAGLRFLFGFKGIIFVAGWCAGCVDKRKVAGWIDSQVYHLFLHAFDSLPVPCSAAPTVVHSGVACGGQTLWLCHHMCLLCL